MVKQTKLTKSKKLNRIKSSKKVKNLKKTVRIIKRKNIIEGGGNTPKLGQIEIERQHNNNTNTIFGFEISYQDHLVKIKKDLIDNKRLLLDVHREVLLLLEKKKEIKKENPSIDIKKIKERINEIIIIYQKLIEKNLIDINTTVPN